MLKKVIGINGSPRKGWNTYLMVQKALEGAKSAGAETKLINLVDLKFGPCQSCLACQKAKNRVVCCSIKDDLQPVLKEIQSADAVIFGTPIYFTYPSGLMHAALERIWFSNHAYTSQHTYFPRSTKTAFIYTMNCTPEWSKKLGYDFIYEHNKSVNESIFKAPCKTLCAFNTQQVKNYSKYAMSMFDSDEKYRSRKEQFPKDLEKAYELGRSLVLDE